MASQWEALLYIDLLGVRAIWHLEGGEGAQRAFNKFRRHVVGAVERATAPGQVLGGGIESDSVALVCDSAETAVKVGIEIYDSAFALDPSEKENRMWMRGSIVPFGESGEIRTRTLGIGELGTLEVFDYHPSLLEGIAVERAGIRGMRLVVEETLIGPVLQDAVKVVCEDQRVDTLIQLPYTKYPGRLKRGYQDVLWMAEPTKLKERVGRMAERLQLAVRDSDEEFAQAAATQVVFHECEAHIKASVAAGRALT